MFQTDSILIGTRKVRQHAPLIWTPSNYNVIYSFYHFCSDTHLNHIKKAVLTCTHNLYFEQILNGNKTITCITNFASEYCHCIITAILTLRERLRTHKMFTKIQYYRSVFTLITISSPENHMLWMCIRIVSARRFSYTSTTYDFMEKYCKLQLFIILNPTHFYYMLCGNLG